MNLLKRIVWWIDDRTGFAKALEPIIHHPVPPGTASGKIGWAYIFGTATLVAFIVQVVTGIALATVYIPSTESAFDSIRFITQDATLGRVLRGMHYFSASAMIVMVGIHVVRVFLTGAFKFPREMNWLSGVVLLLLTLAMAFTGQLLRWDQNAIWSVVVAAEQTGRVPLAGKAIANFLLAGQTLGAATLTRFYAYHVFFIPGLIFAFIGFHLYLVIRNGISEPPTPGQKVDPSTYRERYRALLRAGSRPYWPDAAWREMLFGFLLIVAVVVLALIIGPPVVQEPPDPTVTQAYPRPDWYFLWYFALLALLPPAVEGFVIVLFPLAIGAMFLLLPFIANRGERSPLRRPWAVGTVVTAVLAIGVLLSAGVRAPWSPDLAAKPIPQSVVGSSNREILQGAQYFNSKGCEYCHAVGGYGGNRGPDLTNAGDRLPADLMAARILDGKGNMPAYRNNLTGDEFSALMAFLQSRHGETARHISD